MKKLGSKRTIILILLAIVIIVEAIAFGLSSAKNVKEISLKVTDSQELLAFELDTIKAIDGGSSGYYVILPEIVNGKYIKKYIVGEHSIYEEEEEENGTVEKLPGNKIYLTQTELTNEVVELTVVYDTTEINNQLLYKQCLTMGIGGDSDLIIKGYLPPDAEINPLVIDGTRMGIIIQEISEQFDQSAVIYELFDLEIISDEQPYTLQSMLEISITNIAQANEIIVAFIIEENNEITIDAEIPTVIQNQDIIFETEELNTFALLTVDMGALSVPVLQSLGIMPLGIAINDPGGIPWDGTPATSIKYGAGTSTFPYLIRNGNELAFLAQRINANDANYQDKYYQLANDINLNNMAWTPIGTFATPFRGFFDGAGYTISNLRVNITAYPGNNANAAFGLFGSIGGVDSIRTTIKNLEINSSSIAITPTGNFSTGTATWSIGSITRSNV